MSEQRSCICIPSGEMTPEEKVSALHIAGHIATHTSTAFVEARTNRGNLRLFGTHFVSMDTNPPDILDRIRKSAPSSRYTVNAYTWDGSAADGAPVDVGVYARDIIMLGEADVPVLPAHNPHGYDTSRLPPSILQRLETALRCQGAAHCGCSLPLTSPEKGGAKKRVADTSSKSGTHHCHTAACCMTTIVPGEPKKRATGKARRQAAASDAGQGEIVFHCTLDAYSSCAARWWNCRGKERSCFVGCCCGRGDEVGFRCIPQSRPVCLACHDVASYIPGKPG